MFLLCQKVPFGSDDGASQSPPLLFRALAGSGDDVDAPPPPPPSPTPSPSPPPPPALVFWSNSSGCTVDVEVMEGGMGSTVVEVDVVYVFVEGMKGAYTLPLLLPPSPRLIPIKMQCSEPSFLLARGPVLDQSSQYPSDGVNTKLAQEGFPLHSSMHLLIVKPLVSLNPLDNKTSAFPTMTVSPTQVKSTLALKHASSKSVQQSVNILVLTKKRGREW